MPISKTGLNCKKSMIFANQVYKNEHLMFNKNTSNPETFIFVVNAFRTDYPEIPGTK